LLDVIANARDLLEQPRQIFMDAHLLSCAGHLTLMDQKAAP
jgi:hypothetical protein